MSFIGDILGAITGSTKASKTAAKAATDAANINANTLNTFYNKSEANLSPYSDAGKPASEQYNALLGLPSSVSQQDAEGGFQNYLNNFGFQHELDQGSKAIIGNQASRRLLGSGSTLKALQNYGLTTRDQYRTNYLNSIGNQQALGLNAASALAGVGSNYSGQLVANQNSKATAVGNAALAGAASNTNLLGSALGAAAMLSDERAKTIVAKVGELPDGLPIYEYTYSGDDTVHIGPVAQEVALYQPWALGPVRADGMMTVDYARLEAA